MPIEVSWYQEPRIIYVALKDSITVEDLRTSGVAIQNMVKTGTAPVHELVEVVKLGRFPTDFSQIRGATGYLRESNMGQVLFVDPGKHTLLEFFINAVDKLSK